MSKDEGGADDEGGDERELPSTTLHISNKYHHLQKRRKVISETETLNPSQSPQFRSYHPARFNFSTHYPTDCYNNNAQRYYTGDYTRPNYNYRQYDDIRDYTRPNYNANHSDYNYNNRTRWRNSASIETPRKWTFSRRDFSNHEDKFVFVSYNILGVENASNHRDLYVEVPEIFLEWDYRKNLICKEIVQYNPSILCFQEVDRFDDLANLLQKDGFSGVYQARTGEACDGCAIFWKTELFTVLHTEGIEFKKFDLRDNVAQLCVLKKKNRPNTDEEDSQTSKDISSQKLLVGNIHVLFNPKRGDIKLGQVRIFLENAHRLSQEWGNIPVLLGGDLNCVPKSPLYDFVSSSELDVRLYKRINIGGKIKKLRFPSYYRHASRWTDEELITATGTEGGTHVKHKLKLSSAYLGVPGSSTTRDRDGEPCATSCHSLFMGTLDYIWHTKGLAPVRVLETLPTADLENIGGLPSKKWGSDHLALVCELAFLDPEKELALADDEY